MNKNNVKEYGWKNRTETCSLAWDAVLVLKILAGHKCTDVLDLGCGNGALIRKLIDAGYGVVGVENDAAGAKIAQQSNPEAKIFNLGVQDDPSAVLKAYPNGFDAVVSTQVIEHLYSPHLLPNFASTVLKRDGILLISTPYHGFLKNLALSVFNHWDRHHTPLWEGGHIKFWSRNTLTKLLENAGYRVLSFYGLGRVPYLWKSMAIVAQKTNEK